MPVSNSSLSIHQSKLDRAVWGRKCWEAELVEQSTSLHVRNDPPYTALAHTVDRVIKKRDVLVAVKPGETPAP
jgi:hypothetical protein